MLKDYREQAKQVYENTLRKTLHLLFDAMAFFAGVGAILVMVRTQQFGPIFILGIAALIGFCVIPAFFMRADKHILLRGSLITLGMLVAGLFGLFALGAVSAAPMVFPFIMALSTVLLGRNVSFSMLGILTILLICIGFLHVSGILSVPSPGTSAWNESIGNWVVSIFAVVASCSMSIILADGLRTFLQSANDQAAQKSGQFEALVEYAPEAIVIFDMERWLFTQVNSQAEKLFGLSREEMINKLTPLDLSPEKQEDGSLSSETAVKNLTSALYGGHPTFEWLHKNAQGEIIPCEISLSRIPPFDRELVRGSIIDVSERKRDQQERDQLQAKLASSQKLEAIGQLTGGVAHDFNNLLAVILGNLELLQEHELTEEQLDLVQPCIDATIRGADLTRSMLSFARKATLDPKELDLNSLVRETKNWAGRTLPASIEIETSLLAGLWPVEADASATESALLNLILNARDAMPDGGKLTIETANVRIDEPYVDGREEELSPGRYVMVAVSDSGTGIAKNILKQIFEPFFTTKKIGKGSGLGLSMVQGFMRQSGGTVQIYSEADVGTTVKLYFKASTQARKSQPTVAPGTRIGAAKGERILVAEDEEQVLNVLIATLDASGYSVTPARSGDEAYEIFEADPYYDLLLTDIVMPGKLQGTTLAKKLRAIDTNLPVIFMSGYASEAMVHGNGLRPEDRRLMKPVMRRDLLAAIQSVLPGDRAAE